MEDIYLLLKNSSNNCFNLIILLARFVPFASLSQAQNAPIASRPELQVKQMLARRLSAPKERERFRLYGEEIKIRVKQSSGYYFAMRRRWKIRAKTRKLLMFRHSAKRKDSGKAKKR